MAQHVPCDEQYPLVKVQGSKRWMVRKVVAQIILSALHERTCLSTHFRNFLHRVFGRGQAVQWLYTLRRNELVLAIAA